VTARRAGGPSGRTTAQRSKRTPKNKQKKWRIFQHQKDDCQNTTSATQSTTPTPQKHHIKNTFFAKTPSKNAPPPQIKNYLRKVTIGPPTG
jgi:hypothetical protein